MTKRRSVSGGAGGRVVYAPLVEPDFHFDLDALAALMSERTKLLIINTPQRPNIAASDGMAERSIVVDTFSKSGGGPGARPRVERLARGGGPGGDRSRDRDLRRADRSRGDARLANRLGGPGRHSSGLRVSGHLGDRAP
jgi:hypothetical protein